MKIVAGFVASILITAPLIAHAQATKDCSTPSILKIIRQGSDLYYQLDHGKAHKLFTLGEVSQAVRGCPGDRMLFVIADPDVSVGNLMLPGKEQITKVRYFIQYKTCEVQELSFSLMYPKAPISTDVIGIPPYDDTPPTSMQPTKGPQ
jgi:hypothetical protein